MKGDVRNPAIEMLGIHDWMNGRGGRDEALTILLEYSIHSQQTAYIWPVMLPCSWAHFDMCAIFQVVVDN